MDDSAKLIFCLQKWSGILSHPLQYCYITGLLQQNKEVRFCQNSQLSDFSVSEFNVNSKQKTLFWKRGIYKSMTGKEIWSFIRLWYYSLDINKIFQIALTYADFFWKGRAPGWTSWKQNTQEYTENENKLSGL